MRRISKAALALAAAGTLSLGLAATASAADTPPGTQVEGTVRVWDEIWGAETVYNNTWAGCHEGLPGDSVIEVHNRTTVPVLAFAEPGCTGTYTEVQPDTVVSDLHAASVYVLG